MSKRMRVWPGMSLACVLMLCVPAEAYARFGTRSSGGGARSSSGGGRSSGSGGGRLTVHAAGSGSSGSTGRGPSGWRSNPASSGWGRPTARARSMWAAPPRYAGWGPSRFHVWGYGFAVAPSVVLNDPALSDGELVDPNYLPPPPSVVGALAGSLTVPSQAALLDLQASLEGSLFGGVVGYTGVVTPSVDNPNNQDVLHLAQARLTYALVSGDRGRLRAEVGAHLAVAPDVTFLAPGIGLSGVLGLVGPLGLEGRVFGNLWPYTQLDARAGLSLASASIGFSVGYRVLYLDDHGVLGAANAGATSDLFRGPYVSLALAL